MRTHVNGWFKPSSSATRLHIRSEAYELETHYVPGLGSVRCQVSGCKLCESYGEAKVTHVHVVERSMSLFLLELNREALECELVVGDVIIIQRRKLGDLTETFVRRDGFEATQRAWPANYLAAIGQKLYEKAIALQKQEGLAYNDTDG